MRTNIWIPDKLVIGIKRAANRADKSVSGYFIDLHKAEELRGVTPSGAVKAEKEASIPFFNPRPK